MPDHASTVGATGRSAAASADPQRCARAPRTGCTLERVTVVHVGAMLVFAAWALGGNTEWARTLLSCWGTLGLGITVAAACQRNFPVRPPLAPLRWLWPLALLDVLVITSAFNPSFRTVTDGAVRFFVSDPHLPRWAFLPSTAVPELSLQALWFFNVVYVSCFNLLLVVQRRLLRGLVGVAILNAAVLAVLGTVQRLTGAAGPYFGAVKTPQPYFFASFLYHNHWGAFTLLMAGATLGLVFHFRRRSVTRDVWHSPALAGVVILVFLVTTLPLSTSRSSTLLAILLLAIVSGGRLRRLVRRRGEDGGSITAPTAATLLAVLAVAGFIYLLGRETIALRIENTRDQIAVMQARGEYLPRAILYRDTWQLAREKIWFGWGMASYPTTFYTRNSQFESHDGPNRVYHDAHSDWLQSTAELGLVGTLLIGLSAAVPCFERRRSIGRSSFSRCLLTGCGMVLLYALLEFPFGNRAVVIAFWVCFFCALQYASIERRPARV